MAIESVACASGDSAPSDIAEETNRRRMRSAGSTSSSGIGCPRRMASRSRGPAGRRSRSSVRQERLSVGLARLRSSTACWSATTIGGAQPWSSPSLRKRTRPWSGKRGRRLLAPARKPADAAASTSSRELLEADAADRRRRAGEAGSITSWPSPRASKICAPQYEDRVEIPILERILSRPFSAAARYRFVASAGVGRASADSFRPR